MALSLAVLVLGAGVLQAEPRQHDGGFFMRLSAGGGPMNSKTGDVEFDGPGGDINLAFGKVIRRNLAIHATIFGWLVSDPEVTVPGASGALNTDLDMTALGAGLTYYLEEVNVYLSGSAGLAKLSASGADLEGESDSGLAVDFTAGKEWWVSDRWGLGVAGAAGYHSIPGGIDGTHGGWNLALRFTSTFN